MNKWKAKYQALAAGITDKSLIDNAEKLVKISVDLSVMSANSFDNVFCAILKVVGLLNMDPMSNYSEGMIPILLNHDHCKIIGKMSWLSPGNYPVITFIDDFKVTKEDLFGMINCGFLILESYLIDEVTYMKKIKVLELSMGK